MILFVSYRQQVKMHIMYESEDIFYVDLTTKSQNISVRDALIDLELADVGDNSMLNESIVRDRAKQIVHTLVS